MSTTVDFPHFVQAKQVEALDDLLGLLVERNRSEHEG